MQTLCIQAKQATRSFHKNYQGNRLKHLFFDTNNNKSVLNLSQSVCSNDCVLIMPYSALFTCEDVLFSFVRNLNVDIINIRWLAKLIRTNKV